MRTISETKKVIRIEWGNGLSLHMDYDPDTYFGESDARSRYRDMVESGENPRMYRGTITTELEEME